MVALSDLGRGGGRLKAGGMLDVKLHNSSSINTQINTTLFLFIDRYGRFGSQGNAEIFFLFAVQEYSSFEVVFSSILMGK